MALLLFLGSLGLIAYLPGRVLLVLLRLRVAPLEHLVLSLTLGLCASAAAFWGLASLGQRSLFWAWPLAAGLLAWRLRGPTLERPPLRETTRDFAAVGCLLALAIVALGFAPIYYRNLTPTADGGLTFYPLSDLVIHLSLAQEMTHTIPPTIPSMPGVSRSHHYGSDLTHALFAAVPGLALTDLAARFLPTLFFALALGGAFAAAQALGLGRVGATACAFLVLFGEDFSFLPALLRGAPPDMAWTVTLLQAPTIVALFMMNPMLPALGPLFLALACLARGCQGQGRGFLVAAVVLTACLFDIKVFAAAQMGAALGFAGLLAALRMRDRRLLWATLGLAVLLGPRLVLLLSGEGTSVRVGVALSNLVPHAVVNLGLRNTVLGQAVWELFEQQRVTAGAVLSLLAAAALYLVLVFGLRCLGWPGLVDSFRLRDPRLATRMVVAFFVVLGPLLSLGLVILPADGGSGDTAYNNAVWFLVQSKYVAWIFAAERLESFWRSGSALRRGLLVLVTLALSLPSTVQFMLIQFRERPPALDRRLVEVARFLRTHTTPGQVVLAQGRLGGPLISLAPCRATLPSIFGGMVVPPEELQRRTAGLSSFWEAWESGASIEGPLRAVGHVDHIVARPRQVPSTAAIEVFRNDALAVYRVVPP